MIFKKINAIVQKLRVSRKKSFVIKHKNVLASVSGRFNQHEKVAFIFQTFNKNENIVRILQPFIEARAKNIILFADGCIDESPKTAHKQLIGKNHFVIQSNDTHEIRNYRYGLRLAMDLSCEYAILLQDDDIYTDGIFIWIERALDAMCADTSIAIVGGAGGYNYDPGFCLSADEGLASAIFEEFQDVNGRFRFRLGRYHSMTQSSAKASSVGQLTEFVATVNRSPQMMRISTAFDLGFFPSELEPFQYDDDYNCLKSWSNGFKILHMPTSSKAGNIGEGGMRLYNSVTLNSRPAHFCRNWNYIMTKFGDDINSGKIDCIVNKANEQ
jgi:hypothetical protein